MPNIEYAGEVKVNRHYPSHPGTNGEGGSPNKRARQGAYTSLT